MSGMGIEIGNVEVGEVWSRLKSDSKSVLIDVRTRPEWAFVGVVDLSAIGKTPVFIEWQMYPSNEIDPEFVTKLRGHLDALDTGVESELYFLCRSGVRSLAAARAMANAGYRACFNVANGFEGPVDERRRRGGLGGWKAAGLPWVQS